MRKAALLLQVHPLILVVHASWHHRLVHRCSIVWQLVGRLTRVQIVLVTLLLLQIAALPVLSILLHHALLLVHVVHVTNRSRQTAGVRTCGVRQITATIGGRV